jgi:hypothetical protein
MADPIVPDDPFEDLARAIGMLVISFNELEVALGGALMHLLNQDEATGSVFVSHLSAGVKINLLQGFAFKIADAGLKKEFSELLAQAAEANIERNRFIHSEYWVNPDTSSSAKPITLYRKLRDAHQPTAFPVTIKELSNYIRTVNAEEVSEWANDTAMLAMNLLEFAEKHRPRL